MAQVVGLQFFDVWNTPEKTDNINPKSTGGAENQISIFRNDDLDRTLTLSGDKRSMVAPINYKTKDILFNGCVSYEDADYISGENGKQKQYVNEYTPENTVFDGTKPEYEFLSEVGKTRGFFDDAYKYATDKIKDINEYAEEKVDEGTEKCNEVKEEAISIAKDKAAESNGIKGLCF